MAETATAAGQGEISLALALAMGLLGAFTLLHGAVQFRGVLPLPGRRRACREPASTACWPTRALAGVAFDHVWFP